jgi:hypothetical protein
VAGLQALDDDDLERQVAFSQGSLCVRIARDVAIISEEGKTDLRHPPGAKGEAVAATGKTGRALADELNGLSKQRQTALAKRLGASMYKKLTGCSDVGCAHVGCAHVGCAHVGWAAPASRSSPRGVREYTRHARPGAS